MELSIRLDPTSSRFVVLEPFDHQLKVRTYKSIGYTSINLKTESSNFKMSISYRQTDGGLVNVTEPGQLICKAKRKWDNDKEMYSGEYECKDFTDANNYANEFIRNIPNDMEPDSEEW